MLSSVVDWRHFSHMGRVQPYLPNAIQGVLAAELQPCSQKSPTRFDETGEAEVIEGV
ncbi:hypothetical protein GCM10009038_17410 [Salinicola rhizosphaerae]|uniref:Uncharacterized protein n=1 Tax=Salinicola rhizosphaerae TaxID=1443141 RepID=A0ABQ3E4H1_9GAMM|nr:hypothetical protein GCM10009038_17410 [Salinicola rhizosphaerae]